MTTPQQFGEYLLFRRLTTDGLGETYRAGKIGHQGIERVVLLRLFNGQGVDAESLWRTIADRMGLHRILQNPHIGDGADVGRVGTTPYVAYEYVSGKNLSELLTQARARSFQIPTEHALFITERVTFGLSAAFSTRHRDQRVQHGFLVPENILLSNEGEVRLIGFESAPGLREFLSAAPIREASGPYLAPEVKPGSTPSSTDDVFSLGSLLYELLTGRRLVNTPDGNYDPQIDDATLAAEELPLPPSLRALLKSSLAAKPQRIGDVQQWQQAFSRFISDADYSPTTFNLAFFMHTLFGGEIEQETVDIAREKATQVDLTTLSQAPIAEPTPGPSDTVLIPTGQISQASDDAIDTAMPAGHYGAAGRTKTNWKVLAPLAILAILGGLAAAYYMTKVKKPAVVANLAQAPMPATATDMEAMDPDLPFDGTAEIEGADFEAADPATAETDADLGAVDSVDTEGVAVPPTPDEVESQIRRLVDDRANILEARYEDELAQLRQELEEARQAQEEAAAAVTAATVAPDQSPAQGPAQSAASGASPPPMTTQHPTTPPATPSQTENTDPVSSPELEPALQAADQQESTKPEAKPAPPPPPVSVGDLVGLGPGVIRPEMTLRPSPRYPPTARQLNKQATVRLRILVDENGEVARVERVGADAGFGFDEAALSAAQRTKWRPATKNGVRVKMWVDLKIAFRP